MVHPTHSVAIKADPSSVFLDDYFMSGRRISPSFIVAPNRTLLPCPALPCTAAGDSSPFSWEPGKLLCAAAAAAEPVGSRNGSLDPKSSGRQAGRQAGRGPTKQEPFMIQRRRQKE
jgi:hypothetical protein